MVKILIAEDSESIRLIFKEILSLKKHEIVGEAVDGQEAISKFYKLNPELLLLDLHMPKKTGLEIIKKIRSENNDVKIIVVSGSEGKMIDDCILAGANATILKPFSPNDVLKVISEVFEK